MAVSEIKQYRQKDGTDILKVFTKPTKKFPDGGYFYVDAKDIDVVRNYNWSLIVNRKNIVVTTNTCSVCGYSKFLLFHRELAYKYLGYYPECIDHISGVEFDNTDKNLNEVTQQQNMYNKFVRGYEPRNNHFKAKVMIHKKQIRPYDFVITEVEVCQLQYKLETDYLGNTLKDNYYMYNFLEDRRNDLDILDLERTGIISAEEATYRHVIRYAKDNAWYYYRYNLEQYFKDNHIPIPSFTTDEQGFMRHPVTNELLCPF